MVRTVDIHRIQLLECQCCRVKQFGNIDSVCIGEPIVLLLVKRTALLNEGYLFRK